MSKIKLEFISPKVLNNLKHGHFTNKVVWGYDNVPGTDLTIDTDNWNIECVGFSQKGSIMDWLVNEDTNPMVLKSGVSKEDNSEIEFPFAVAMLGQLAGPNNLIRNLASLQETFDGFKSKDDAGEQQEDTYSLLPNFCKLIRKNF
jgi:hypothetical protein